MFRHTVQFHVIRSRKRVARRTVSTRKFLLNARQRTKDDKRGEACYYNQVNDGVLDHLKQDG